MTKPEYSTNLKDRQWQLIQKYLPPQRVGKGRPRADLRRVINAILYLQKTGCQWRMLPGEFLHWRTVYGWFRTWIKDGTWLQIHTALVQQVRKKAGKKPKPTVGILDSQSVKTSTNTGLKGYDGGKKIKGRKRHIVVDTLGLIWSLMVTPADVREEDGGIQVIQKVHKDAKKLKTIYADSAYQRKGLPDVVEREFGIKMEIVYRRAHEFVVQPKRWIVERTFGWFNFDRRLCKDYEVRNDCSENMIYIGMMRRMLNRLLELIPKHLKHCTKMGLARGMQGTL